MKTIAIVGAGASGLMCAITILQNLKYAGARVVLLEKNERAGKKLLATGNGKCNLTNTYLMPDMYHSHSREKAFDIIKNFNDQNIIEFFSSIGVVCKTANGTCVYPRSMQASSVLDAMRFELERLGGQILGDFEVCDIKAYKTYELISTNQSVFKADIVVVASGTNATFGTNIGINLLKKTGHRIFPLYPALTQLKCDNTHIKTAKGMRTDANVSLLCDKKIVHSECGEVLFTDYGLSGIAVMQLSGIAAKLLSDNKNHNISVCVDMAQEYGEDELFLFLKDRAKKLSHLNAENFLTGFINKRIGVMVIKKAIGSLSVNVSELSDADIKNIVKTLKCFESAVTGTNGFKNAQVCGGGASIDDFDDSLCSKIVPNLYACGEVLDVYGECGGYNLTWAWASGYACAMAIANTINKD